MRTLVIASLLAACAPARAPAAPPPPAPVTVEPRRPAEPTPPPPDEVAPPPKPSEAPWLPAWPALSLEPLTPEQVEAAKACPAVHGGDGPNASREALLATATCFGEVPAPGREVATLLALTRRFPDTVEAFPRLGRLYEQVGREAQAVDVYETYLRRFPKQGDARELGQRAVCLARSLDLAGRAEEIVHTLDKLYQRRGFERPADLSTVCEPPT